MIISKPLSSLGCKTEVEMFVQFTEKDVASAVRNVEAISVADAFIRGSFSGEATEKWPNELSADISVSKPDEFEVMNRIPGMMPRFRGSKVLIRVWPYEESKLYPGTWRLSMNYLAALHHNLIEMLIWRLPRFTEPMSKYTLKGNILSVTTDVCSEQFGARFCMAEDVEKIKRRIEKENRA